MLQNWWWMESGDNEWGVMMWTKRRWEHRHGRWNGMVTVCVIIPKGIWFCCIDCFQNWWWMEKGEWQTGDDNESIEGEKGGTEERLWWLLFLRSFWRKGVWAVISNWGWMPPIVIGGITHAHDHVGIQSWCHHSNVMKVWWRHSFFDPFNSTEKWWQYSDSIMYMEINRNMFTLFLFTFTYYIHFCSHQMLHTAICQNTCVSGRQTWFGAREWPRGWFHWS